MVYFKFSHDLNRGRATVLLKKDGKAQIPSFQCSHPYTADKIKKILESAETENELLYIVYLLKQAKRLTNSLQRLRSNFYLTEDDKLEKSENVTETYQLLPNEFCTERSTQYGYNYKSILWFLETGYYFSGITTTKKVDYSAKDLTYLKQSIFFFVTVEALQYFNKFKIEYPEFYKASDRVY